jgi:cellulose synthase/poly-beta-1,6-N-acetylglucosamine synthase-like glycosyltransferase
MTSVVLDVVQWGFLGYFIVLNGAYLALTSIAFVAVWRYAQRQVLDTLPPAYSGLEVPITLIVPAHNEAATIAGAVRSLFQLTYPELEIVVVNDGSTDATLEVLTREFDLVKVPEAFRVRLATAPVRAVYHSRRHPELRVLDKENGGKADALNAGINAARYPLFCGLDADSVLQRDSLERVVRPFLEDARTVAAGGIVRLANGCDVVDGFVVRTGVPRTPLALVQVVEYLRAFLLGRLGWSPWNALLVISGAFGLFHKETAILAGGYRTDTVGEDMELVVRLHRILRTRGQDYRIVFVPDPVCWTEGPENWRVLRGQRMRWQRGLAESLSLNRALLCSRRGGLVGWVAFPFALLFEWASPIVEVAGYAFFAVGYAAGVVSLEFAAAFMLVAVGLGVLLSIWVLLIEEMSFHTYPRLGDVVLLIAASVGENFGYRQMIAWWRLRGLWSWAIGRKAHWGAMTRTASWQRGAADARLP